MGFDSFTVSFVRDFLTVMAHSAGIPDVVSQSGVELRTVPTSTPREAAFSP